jgi:hypothetical protein
VFTNRTSTAVAAVIAAPENHLQPLSESIGSAWVHSTPDGPVGSGNASHPKFITPQLPDIFEKPNADA